MSCPSTTAAVIKRVEMEFADKFKEEETIAMDDESESFSESFICCVCRDLLYKPVVLVCGHISCFWCVHKSMSGLHKSRCPICRNQYYHFPSICQMLHLLLLKMYPIAYKRRENETLEEEKQMGCFSPQCNDPAYQLQTEETIVQPSGATVSGDSEPSPTPERMNPVQSVHEENGLDSLIDCRGIVTTSSVTSVEDRNKDQLNSRETYMQVSVDDVLCGCCKHFLFQPTVLNCGHAFCIGCIAPKTSAIFKCEVCQNPHPGEDPKVCLEFDHFLEEQFPIEYQQRRDTLKTKQDQFLNETSITSSSEADKKLSSGKDPLPWWHSSSKIHIGVGCDSCGMYPIIGDRYRCKDCQERMGYDLCKDCYTTHSKLPGRFNQQHTSEHKFEFVRSNAVHNIMLRLLRGHGHSAVSDALNDGSTNVVPSLSDNADGDAENYVIDDPLPSSETEPDHQSGNPQSG